MNQIPTTQQPPPKTGQYFEQRRRGEMNELKSLLNNLINDPQSKKGRQVVKKVIGYMTLGMDASPVFSQMCRASYTNDQVTKKMIYFYLTTYAEDNSELAIMAVNTFKKDCKHSSSKIRGLALRNLCSFKSMDYVNNVLPLIRELLHDFQPYVKKTAIIGVLKVFYYEPQTIYNDQSIINTLSSLIKDADPLVSANAILALNQILTSEGGIPLNSKLVNYLINRLKQYNEWSQTAILDILYNYTPKNQKENYEIMTVLWDKLKHSSSSLVLASIKIIIKLSKDNEQLFKSVIQKIKSPLLTLMTGSQNSGFFENSYVILQHIDYTISEMGGKMYYEKDFKYFYCRADQPTYTKLLKIKILGKLANEYNLGDMLNQLNDYATDIDIPIARKSIQILANIALSLPQVSKALIINLVSFCKSQQNYVINQTVISFYYILRKYPNLFNDVKSILIQNYTKINENQSIKCFLWILGTFAQQIEDSPYIVEQYIQGTSQSLTGNFQDYNQQIKQVLLTQTLQIFLKRPPQTFSNLNKIFKLIFYSDKSSMLLRDHASYYYRALKDNPNDVKKALIVLNTDISAMRDENWGNNAQQDFNNMAIIYKRKENKFIKNFQHFNTMRNKELGLIQPKTQQEDQEEAERLIDGEVEKKKYDYNEIDASDLQQFATLTAQQFQQTWNNLTQYQDYTVKLNSENAEFLDEQQVQQLFKMWHVHCIASAEDDNILKFYMYICHNEGHYVCMEIQVNKSQNQFSVSTKANNIEILKGTIKYVHNLMEANQLISG